MSSYSAAGSEPYVLCGARSSRRRAPTATTKRNQSVDANPTPNPKRSDATCKQGKPAPSAILSAASHKISSRMIADADSNAEEYADAGTKTSSSFVEPISFATVEEHVLEDISLLDVQIKKCCAEFEKNPQKPVVVFTNVHDPDKAMQLWEESDCGNLVMVTSNNELVIYELVSKLHEAVAGSIVKVIHSYLRDIETSADNGPIDISPFIQYLGTGREKGKEPDGQFVINTFSNGEETEVTTVVIEVAWTQKFTGIGGLLKKGEQWVDENEVQVVVLVNLYGYRKGKDPGMLVCLMDNTKQIYEAIGYGAIDQEDEKYFDDLDGIDITRVGDRARKMLKIDGHLVFGIGAENPQEQLKALIEAYAVNGDNNRINRITKNAIQATLDWVKALTCGNIPQVEIDLCGLYASFIKRYRQHQETYK